MKSKFLNHSDAILAIALMLAFCVAAFICFIAMVNVINDVTQSIAVPLSGADKYLTSLPHN